MKVKSRVKRPDWAAVSTLWGLNVSRRTGGTAEPAGTVASAAVEEASSAVEVTPLAAWPVVR